MSKWQKCGSCGKAFLKKDVQNGVCIVCSAGSIPSSSGAEANSSDSNFTSENPSLQSTSVVGRKPQNASSESQKTANQSNGTAGQISGYAKSNLDGDKTLEERPTFSSSVQAITFLEVLYSLVLLIGVGASVIVFYRLWISDNKFLAFMGLTITLLAFVIGWAVNRVFIGIAKDIRVSRDNSDELLAITKERFDQQ